MRRASTVVMLAMLVVFVGVTIAAASDFNQEFHGRLAHQQTRIDNGIRKGELTQSEAQVLTDNMNWLKGEEARLKADGRLTPREQERLMKMLDDNSKMIGNKRKNYKRLY
jgi:polyhydroxyalkanoate synthesis regulator phasin